VVREQSVAIEAAQLLERLILDLADPLPADLELLTDLSQRMLVAVTKSKPELQDQLLTRRQGVKRGAHVALQH
jgi:hypothetical protein